MRIKTVIFGTCFYLNLSSCKIIKKIIIQKNEEKFGNKNNREYLKSF